MMRDIKRRAGRCLAIGSVLVGFVPAHTAVFDIVPDQSAITVSGELAGFNILEQGPGSLTTRFSGTLNADVTPNAIAFPGGSAIVALNNGDWEPKAQGEPGTEPANIGGRATAPLGLGSAKAAVREAMLEVTGAETPVAAGSFDASGLVFSFPETAGTALDYTANLLGVIESGRELLSGNGTNEVAASATIAQNGSMQTLTIPIDAEFTFTLVSEDDTTLKVVGQLVATRTLGSDPDTYDGWAAEQFQGETDPTIVGPEADPDNDWLKNFVEFAFALHPLEFDPNPPPVAAGPDLENPAKWIAEYVRPKGRKGVVYGSMTSPTVNDWLPSDLPAEITDLGDGRERVRLTADRPTGGGDSFILVTVTPE